MHTKASVIVVVEVEEEDGMFKPQLSEDVAKCKEPLTFPKLFSTKLDGIRCVTVNGQALSRSLKAHSESLHTGEVSALAALGR